MIDTPDGPRAVDDLRPGDLVTTLDDGPQPIRWVRRSDHALDTTTGNARPVLISAGALGAKRPSHDLIVSPQHRILVGSHQQLSDCFASEAFAPAKSLTGLRGVRFMMGKRHVRWMHFACERHQVVSANGCHTESLLLGPMVLAALDPDDRRVLLAVFPAGGRNTSLNGEPARRCLSVGDARRLIASVRKARTAPGQPPASHVLPRARPRHVCAHVVTRHA